MLSLSICNTFAMPWCTHINPTPQTHSQMCPPSSLVANMPWSTLHGMRLWENFFTISPSILSDSLHAPSSDLFSKTFLFLPNSPYLPLIPTSCLPLSQLISFPWGNKPLLGLLEPWHYFLKPFCCLPHHLGIEHKDGKKTRLPEESDLQTEPWKMRKN